MSHGIIEGFSPIVGGGAVGFMVPPRPVEHPEEDVFRRAHEWQWPKSACLMLKPREKGVVIDVAERHVMTRLSLECEISCKGKYQKRETTLYTRSQNWVPSVDYPDEFYGFKDIPWQNVFEKTQTAGLDVRLAFMEPAFDELAWLEKRYGTVSRDRICEEWTDRRQQIEKLAAKDDPHYRIEHETARVYCFKGLVRIAYHSGPTDCEAWFNLGNGQVHITKGQSRQSVSGELSAFVDFLGKKLT